MRLNMKIEKENIKDFGNFVREILKSRVIASNFHQRNK